MDGASIYILKCIDGSCYTGITRREVATRVSEHEQAIDPECYTASRLPVKLVFSEQYARLDEAIATERRIKGWSRAKKEAYMQGDFEGLSRLARRRAKFGTSAPASFETLRKGSAPQDEGLEPFQTLRQSSAPQDEGLLPPAATGSSETPKPSC